jgi:hypothetical protein
MSATWLWNNGVIEVCDLDSSESCISSIKVNTISVQWESWQWNASKTLWKIQNLVHVGEAL